MARKVRFPRQEASRARLVVTVEENVLAGGFGEGVLDALAKAGVDRPVLTLGVPDRFVAHATVSQQLEKCGLTALGISNSVMKRCRVRSSSSGGTRNAASNISSETILISSE